MRLLRQAFATLRISTKITASFIVVACIILAGGVMSIVFIHQLLEDEEYTFRHQVVPLKILSSISEEFTKARVFVRDIVNRPDRAKYLDSLKSVEQELMRLNAAYGRQIAPNGDAERAIFQTYKTSVETYFASYIQPIAESVRSGDVEQAKERQLRMSNFADAVGGFHKLQTLKQQEVEITKNAHHEWATFIKQALIFAIVLGFGLAAVLGWWIGRLIGMPITEMRTAAARVAQGDLDVTITNRSRDELGDLGESINQMIQAIHSGIWNLEQSKQGVEKQVEQAVADIDQQRVYLSHSVERMLASVEQLSRGNLTEHLSVTSNDDIGRLFLGYNSAVEQISTALVTVAANVRHAAVSAEQILSSVEQISASVHHQSERTKTIAAAVGGMKESIDDGTRNAMRAAEQASATSAAAQAGGKVIQETIEAMNRIALVVGRSAERVEELGRSNEQISEILRVIEEIADQTNLLALNASIEAARAGEHGRGFAVVADEVRKLAERTQQATKEIGVTVRLVQHGTAEAVRAMNAGTNEVESGRRSIAASQQALQTIVHQTQEVATIIHQLASASAEYAAVSTEIAENTSAISAMLEETVHATDDIARSAHQFNGLMTNVERHIQHFRLRDTLYGKAQDTIQDNRQEKARRALMKPKA